MLLSLGAHLLAQVSSSSTSRFVSPTVVASWTSRTRGTDTDTLLVLWRGSPGWFAKTGVSGGSSGGSVLGHSQETQYFHAGGREFTMEFIDDRRVVKILNQEILLTTFNVVLVDGVDSTAGPVIVERRWVEPGAPLPPIVAGAASDPVAGVISRSPALIEYLQCGVPLRDPQMNVVVDFVCRRMRGEAVTLPGLPPR
ncbi:MAG TPA: hypothetical protein VFP91_14150 [Vicinamibacterales bacterium]|nr:hypothetical protein [Vicinamibacterales bacterium]